MKSNRHAEVSRGTNAGVGLARCREGIETCARAWKALWHSAMAQRVSAARPRVCRPCHRCLCRMHAPIRSARTCACFQDLAAEATEGPPIRWHRASSRSGERTSVTMLERGTGLPQVRRNSEVPSFGELLNGSLRDRIRVGHENSLERQRTHLRNGLSHRRARTSIPSDVRGCPDFFVASPDACCHSPSPVVACAGGYE